MSDLGPAFLAGVAAGLAVAIPLGPIGILILETGLAHGLPRAVAAALGTATIDLGYALLAISAGSLAGALIAPYATPIRLVSAAILVAIAVRGLTRLRRTDLAPDGGVAPTPVTWGVLPTYLRFLGLTAVNPLTVLYFTALVIGLPAIAGSPGARGAFGLGVGLGSGAWQLALAGVGAVLHHRLPPRARAITGIVGDVIILLLAAGILASTLS